jgi:TonB family protein
MPVETTDLRGSEQPVNIDYSNLQPGDDAPDPENPARPRGQAHAPAQHPAPQGAQHDAQHADQQAGQPATKPNCANVVVLSADPTLIDLLRDSLAGIHRVWRADDATHAADLMVASGNAVLLIDASLADHNTKDLVNQVHKQFPDLAIIVAGRRDDEHELAPLVSEGIIFRFLHKPASAERIRHFVDSTQRRPNGTDLTATMPPRHKNQLFGGTSELPVLSPIKLKLDDGFTRRWGRRSLLLVPIALVAWGIVEWEPWNRMSLDSPGDGAQPVATADAGEAARIQKLLDSAGLALSQGALIEPPGQNALELYRAVLARDPGNDLARRGLDSVAEELLVQAERALMEQDLTRLASAVDAVRSVRPDHSRLEFFVSQLERERALQGQSGQPVRAVDSMGRPIESAAKNELPSVRVQAFVQLANERMRSNKLTGTDSAQSYLISARNLDRTDPGVQAGVSALAGMLQTLVQKATNDKRLDDANRWMQAAIEIGASDAQVAAMRADIAAARNDNIRSDNSKLLILANQRIAQGRLVEPKGDSAGHYVSLLRASDPAFDGLADTSLLLASRALAESKAALAANNPDRAESYLRAAADAGAPAAEVSDLSAKIMSLRIVRPAAAATSPTAKAPPAVLPESQMHRTFFIAPTYPARALERETEGWVDLEFTVTKDGTTSDAQVRASEPAGTFDRAAMDAVKRWRYEPRVVNGAVVEQRVETRLRFRLEQ